MDARELVHLVVKDVLQPAVVVAQIVICMRNFIKNGGRKYGNM